MFARVVTAEAGSEGFGNVIDLADQQLSVARHRPGFQGLYLLTGDQTGKLITISFWDTRQQMEEIAQGTATGSHDQSIERRA